MTVQNHADFAAIDTPLPSRAEVAAMVSLAARTVAPLWPLESAIAVNPLSGFEDLGFDEAVARAARRFGARDHMALRTWRRLLQAGRIDAGALRDAAIAALGGVNAAFSPIGPDLSPLDLLMARLIDLPASPAPAATALPADAAFVAKWCAAFFDQGMAASPMPNRDLGLYRAVLALAPHDRDYRALTGTIGRRLLLSVPRDPHDAIAEGLIMLGVPAADQVDYLATLVARLPGWAGHIRWRSDHAEPSDRTGAPAGMADLVALWVLLERGGTRAGQTAPSAPGSNDAGPALLQHFGLSPATLKALDDDQRAHWDRVSTLSESVLAAIYMAAAETGLRDDLVRRLRGAVRHDPPVSRADAQLVFCIDVRSEPFRRAIEAQGAYETLGYAGFFGLPIARAGADTGGRRERLLPVLLAPSHDVLSVPAPGQAEAAAQANAAAARRSTTTRVFDQAKQGLATAFATAEATGPLAGAVMALRTFAPRLAGRLATTLTPPADPLRTPCVTGFTLAEKLGYAQLLFRLTGLTNATARLVVLTGHSGAAVNNPYAAALDCGACGGHPGGFNARVLAKLLNDGDVRAGLAAQDFALPDSTVFIAAEHNTTTDEVTVFDRAAVPASHQADLAALERDLARAGVINRQFRAHQLGRSADDLLTAAVNWAEVRPEWGLSGNAAFVVGPRWLSRDCDLGARAFLHSYDWRTDADGTVLAMILTAPMVVAQWINCQYLFSTIDNDAYGSGDKTTQNVIGRIGVVQGNGGDLRVGLPRQSLFADDGTPWHVPQRLLTVVLAPFDRVEAVIGANDILMRLFGNGWVQLVVIDPHTGKALRWATDDETSQTSETPITEPENQP